MPSLVSPSGSGAAATGASKPLNDAQALNSKSSGVRTVVLAYSGGLDTSIIIPWLRENYDCEVIAMVGDVGQGDDYDAVREKALRTGASKVFVEDLREEFITQYLWK